MYEYRAALLRVVDADTLWLEVDVGLDIRNRLTVRLYGLNAPEKSTAAGAAATGYTTRWLTATPRLGLRTVKDKREKYGRYLGIVYDLDQPDAPTLNELLVADGHAQPYMP